MARQGNLKRLGAALIFAALTTGGVGCHYFPTGQKCCKPPKFDPCCLPDTPVPKELNKVSLPPYVIETPDILVIDAIRVIPLPPYRVEPLDMIYINADPATVLRTDPINGVYPIDPDGTIDLGTNYGNKIQVAGLTTDEIQRAITAKLKQFVNDPKLTVSLAQSRGVQQIAGQHIVRPDGTVGLGSYGSVYVAGLTIAQAKAAIEAHLAKYLYRPEVAVDVYSFNSKYYYVITDFAGNGEQVVRLPHTGNETVLDAVSQIGGLSAVSSKKLWVARPAPTECGHDQILPVDWCGITMRGQVKTNYQILPGDRVYILAQPVTTFDTYYARLTAPIYRTLGLTIYGTSAYNAVRNVGRTGVGGNIGNGGVILPITP